MKNLIILFALSLVLSSTAMARVAQIHEDIIEDDLNFKLEQDEKEVREVASDDSEDSENTEKDSKNEDGRDVASENEEIEMNIKYWKY